MNHIKFDFNGANIRVAIANQDFTTPGGRHIKAGTMIMCASDVAKALNHTQPAQAVRDHCDSKGVVILTTPSKGGPQKTKFIDWPEVYKLILSSKTETALRFRAWVTEEVLPAINNNGQYRLPGLDEQADLDGAFEPGWYDITEEQKGIIDFALYNLRPSPRGRTTEHDMLVMEAYMWWRQFCAYHEGMMPPADASLLAYTPRPTLEDGTRPTYIRQTLSEALRDMPNRFTYWELREAALRNHRMFLSTKCEVSVQAAFEKMVKDGAAVLVEGHGILRGVYEKTGRPELVGNAQN